MLIAISQRQDKNKYDSLTDNLDSAYTRYFERMGVELLALPNSSKRINKYFELPIKGVILSSGNDVNPQLYNSSEKGQSVSAERDSTEKKILQIAVKKKLPVFGMCRGMEFVNVFFGGKLARIDANGKVKHVASNHAVQIIDEKAKSFGSKFIVNSFHNYGIPKDLLSRELRPFAASEDGLIEGFYHMKLPIAGVMWHPERKSPNETANRKIVQAFSNKRSFWNTH